MIALNIAFILFEHLHDITNIMTREPSAVSGHSRMSSARPDQSEHKNTMI